MGTFKRSTELPTIHLTQLTETMMRYFIIVSLLAAFFSYSQGELMAPDLGEEEVSLPGYGYFRAPIISPQLYYSARKRNLQKKSKEKHRMLFTRMGRSDPFYQSLEEAADNGAF